MSLTRRRWSAQDNERAEGASGIMELGVNADEVSSQSRGESDADGLNSRGTGPTV